MTTKGEVIRIINVATEGLFSRQTTEFQLHRALTATLWVFNTHASNDLNYRMDIAPGTDGEDEWDRSGTWLWQEKTASNPIVAGAPAESVDISEGWAMRGRLQVDDDSVHADAIVTISSPSATAVASTGTVTLSSVLADDTVTVNGLIYTAVSSTKSDNTEFDISGTDIADAADLADSITNDSRTPITVPAIDVTAANGGSAICTITASTAGVDGNLIDLSSSNGGRLAVSGAFLTGGDDADIFTVNGLPYTAVAGAKANNTEFSIDSTDEATAIDLADSISNDTRTGITVPTEDVSATNATAAVTVTAVAGGTAGNSIDISSNDGSTLPITGDTAGDLDGGTDLQSSYHAFVIVSGTW